MLFDGLKMCFCIRRRNAGLFTLIQHICYGWFEIKCILDGLFHFRRCLPDYFTISYEMICKIVLVQSFVSIVCSSLFPLLYLPYTLALASCPPPHLTNFVAIRDLIELLARYDYICFVDFSWRTKQRTRCKYDWNSHHCICQWKKRDGNSKFDHAHRSSCPKTKILKQRSEMEMRPNIRNTHWKVFTVGIVWHMYVCVVQRYCKLCT